MDELPYHRYSFTLEGELGNTEYVFLPKLSERDVGLVSAVLREAGFPASRRKVLEGRTRAVVFGGMRLFARGLLVGPAGATRRACRALRLDEPVGGSLSDWSLKTNGYFSLSRRSGTVRVSVRTRLTQSRGLWRALAAKGLPPLSPDEALVLSMIASEMRPGYVEYVRKTAGPDQDAVPILKKGGGFLFRVRLPLTTFVDDAGRLLKGEAAVYPLEDWSFVLCGAKRISRGRRVADEARAALSSWCRDPFYFTEPANLL
ncbi:MAG: hypothetical protein JRN39_01450 [Nitrososphaerota archaeon]|nr:hypothetical protein [Nitrososphaerota archaeon]